MVGTIALILVSGGIFAHNIEYFHHLFPTWPVIVKELTFGIVAGLLAVAVAEGGKKRYQHLRSETCTR
ncbi:hypothetical protein [Mucilaginibacter antarcticus]|uniref:hypothetical protein n=1 Tax=Mucilaginibacter antarcticus TaxID=1855725 RepID=UPI003644FCD9